MTTHQDYTLEEVEKITFGERYESVLEIGAGLNSFEQDINSENYTKIDNEDQYTGDSIKMDAHYMEYENE